MIPRLKPAAITLLALFLSFVLLNLIFPVPDNIEYSTIITDDKGETVHAFLTRDQQWRMKTLPGEVSPLLRKTIIAKEDRYFYYHPGVNPFAVARAVFMNSIRMKRTSGASTITMQVARALEPKSRTWINKLVEMFRALQLEWRYSKDEILQMYLNLAPYGGNIQGVKSASLLYFGKNPDHLSLAEITTLAVIPNRPSTLVIGRNNERVLQVRNRWLRQFAREKVFSEKEIEDALREPLTAQRGSVPAWIPHLSYKLKRSGNAIVNTNINMNMQRKVEDIVVNYVHSTRLKNIRNAAVIIISNTTHKIITYAGSAGFADSTDGGQVNGAAAIRQPGSTLKPLLYGMCIDQGLLTPKMVITDVAVNFDGYAPENYDRKFNGYVTMAYALEHSLNIPAVKSLRALGKDRLVDKLSACNFSQITKDRRKLGLSLILGGCGATLEELAGLYSAFACNGVFTAPAFTRADGSAKQITLLSPAANFMITEILSKVNRPDFPLNWSSTAHMPKIAWKTGTSYGRRDGWSIGYNRHYTVGVWTGNFSAAGVAELSGSNIATPLLFKIFNTIDYDSDEGWYCQPPGCDLRKVCSETGLPPNDHCTDIVTDYFIPLVSPAGKCEDRKEVSVSPDEKLSYCSECRPQSGYKRKWYRLISPEMQAWMDDNKVAYTRIPPHNPDCGRIFREGAPQVLSPSAGTEYIFSRRHPEPLQLSCRAGVDVAKVYWYINDKFFKSAAPGNKQFFLPPEGPVKISCTDDKGRNKDLWISVRFADL